ncbi:MAG TPA: hypothetical protein VFZ69_06410 [Longimicrobiales bacterium]
MRKPRQITPTELDRLELTIRRLLESHEMLERRAAAAESHVRELEAAMQELAAGRLDPVALGEEVRTLQQRNATLENRLLRARESVDRMMSRLQFTMEER